ncbi:MAG: (2Fe-2S)-binding protein [Clostridium sp.]
MGLFKNLFSSGEKEYVCRCKRITEEMLVKSIKEGNYTYEALTEKTKVGLGLCRGKKCRAKIEEIIEKNR